MSARTGDRAARPTTPAPTVEGSPELSHRQVLMVFAGLMAGMAVAALDQTIVSTALPTIVGDLGGLDRISWIVTAYVLASTAVMPLVGKLSDIYGRKPLFQASIALFTLGSLLCGLSATMNQLIAFRAIQGVGAGSLIVLVFAIVGDILSPRDRGRYQGLIASVFAVSSVIGPFIGGFIVDNFDWSWVFFVNIPVGIAALAITQRALHIPIRRLPQKIDWLGAILLMGGVVCLILATVWGGNEYGWASAQIIGLFVAGLALVVLFVTHARRIEDPVVPVRLFRTDVFRAIIAISVAVGMAMFGAIVFLPLYLQVVQGRSATNSGLLMLPLMVGVLIASITSGRLVSRIGRYRVFPIIGSALMVAGYVGFASMDESTPIVLVWAFMLVTGLGLGAITPILVTAVQNAVDWTDLGAATSATTFFRQLGASFGTAIFGAVFYARFSNLAKEMVPGSAIDPRRLLGSPEQIRALPPAVQTTVTDVVQRSLQTVFTLAIPLAVLTFVLAWLVPERPLRTHTTSTTTGEAGPIGVDIPA
jgi:EmrB/QacA subfamily drug resistance transporter